MKNEEFVNFSKPFFDSLRNVFKTMLQLDIKPHSPRFKEKRPASGDISSVIGMNGSFTNDPTKLFQGLLVLSFSEDVYIKLASSMLMEEYTVYSDEIADVGAELANIILGNSKQPLFEMGYKLGMTTPTTIRGKNHEIKYPNNTTVIETTIDTAKGSFILEICFQSIVNK